MELEEEAVAVPLLLLAQAVRIAVAASKRKVTLTNIFSGTFACSLAYIPDNKTNKSLTASS